MLRSVLQLLQLDVPHVCTTAYSVLFRHVITLGRTISADFQVTVRWLYLLLADPLVWMLSREQSLLSRDTRVRRGFHYIISLQLLSFFHACWFLALKHSMFGVRSQWYHVRERASKPTLTMICRSRKHLVLICWHLVIDTSGSQHEHPNERLEVEAMACIHSRVLHIVPRSKTLSPNSVLVSGSLRNEHKFVEK